MAIQQYNMMNALNAGTNMVIDQRAARTRNAMADLELQNAPTEIAQRNQLNAQKIGANQNALAQAEEAQAAQEVVAAAQWVTQSQSPKAFAQQRFPQLVAQLQQQGVQWETLSDDDVRTMAQEVGAQYAAKLGQGPAAPKAPEAYTLSAGQTRFVDGKPVAAVPQNPGEAGFTLTAGQTRYDANGRPIASAAPSPGSGPDGQPVDFGKVQALRKEYNDASKDLVLIGDAYTKIQQAAQNPSAAGDMSLVFGYMKMLDPGSTVREGEFANAQNATGVPGRVVNAYNKALSGEILAPTQRTDFINQAGNIYKSQKLRHEKTVVPRYKAIAERWGMNVDDVIGNFDVPDTGPAPPQQSGPGTLPIVNTPEEAMRLPSGTRFRTPDGREKVRP